MYPCFRSNMTEALEWLIEHQDDSDEEGDDETDLLSEDTTDANVAGPSSSINTKKKSLKDAYIEFFETGNFYIENMYCMKNICLVLENNI